jgi:transcriptional repressor NrdR
MELNQSGHAEVPSATIGDLVMAKLKKTDQIAYIRFASVYREYQDITKLKEEVDNLAGKSLTPPVDQLPLLPVDEMPAKNQNRRRVKQ